MVNRSPTTPMAGQIGGGHSARNRNRRRILGLLAAAFLFGVLAANALDSIGGQPGEISPPEELAAIKRDLLDTSGLDDLHHEIHKAVGEIAWEGRIKPGFMSDLTWAVITDTGNLFPGAPDIIRWAKRHPAEVRVMLRRFHPSPE